MNKSVYVKIAWKYTGSIPW